MLVDCLCSCLCGVKISVVIVFIVVPGWAKVQCFIDQCFFFLWTNSELC